MTDDAPYPDETWRYGGSRLRFRGPAVDVDAPHVAVVGSGEVAGRYADAPLTAHMAEALGLPVANLGVHNGGLDAALRDDALMEALPRASLRVVQAMGAHAMSNRLYTVHPRRNDRVLCHSDRMRALWPEVDFTDFTFVRHMLLDLLAKDADRFEAVAEELRAAWTARMDKLSRRLDGPTLLLVIADAGTDALGPEPLFVPDAAVASVADAFAGVVRVDVRGLRGDVSGLEEMDIPEGHEDAAARALPPLAHERVARALVEAAMPLLAGVERDVPDAAVA